MHNGMLHSNKKKQTLNTRMNLKDIILMERSQASKSVDISALMERAIITRTHGQGGHDYNRRPKVRE